MQLFLYIATRQYNNIKIKDDVNFGIILKFLSILFPLISNLNCPKILPIRLGVVAWMLLIARKQGKKFLNYRIVVSMWTITSNFLLQKNSYCNWGLLIQPGSFVKTTTKTFHRAPIAGSLEHCMQRGFLHAKVGTSERECQS